VTGGAGRERLGPAFWRVWATDTISEFGNHVTSLAMSVLVVVLRGTATQVGLVNAAGWVPYLLLGLFVGAAVDLSAAVSGSEEWRLLVWRNRRANGRVRTSTFQRSTTPLSSKCRFEAGASGDSTGSSQSRV